MAGHSQMIPLWVAMAVLFSIIVGLAAGTLTAISGRGVATAIIAGGAAFGGTLTLGLLTISVLKG